MYAAMAQLVEHILGKDEVPGPNPGSSSNETLVERRGLLVSMGENRPHPFAAASEKRKDCRINAENIRGIIDLFFRRVYNYNIDGNMLQTYMLQQGA